MIEIGFSSRLRRILASIIDGVIIGIAGLIPMSILLSKEGFAWLYSHHYSTLILPSLYYVLLHGPPGKGQTLGKKLMHLRVVTIQGEIPTYSCAVVRYSFHVLLPVVINMLSGSSVITFKTLAWSLIGVAMAYSIIDALFLFIDPGRRTLHDFFAKTVVISHRGEFVSEEVAQFVKTKFEPFQLTRRWGISVAVIGCVFLIGFAFVKKMPPGYQAGYPNASDTRHNFVLASKMIITEKDNYAEIMALEVKEANEEQRKENIRLLVMDLLKEGKIKEKNEYRVQVFPSIKFNIFNIRETIGAGMKGLKTYSMDPKTSIVTERPELSYAVDTDLVVFLKTRLNLSALKKPWKRYTWQTGKDFSFLCFTLRDKENADFYLAATSGDKPMRFSEMFKSFEGDWKINVADSGIPEDLYLNNGGKLTVHKVSISYTDRQDVVEGYEGSIVAKKRTLYFLWEPYQSSLASLTRILTDIVEQNP